MKLVNMTETHAEIAIFGEIGGFFDGLDAKTVIEDIRAKIGNSPRVVVNICSPGGSVIDGLAIYAMLKSIPAQKEVRIAGVAASIASVIAMAGDKVVMPAAGLMMIHNPLAYAGGDSEELRKAADMLDTVKNSIVSAYALKTKRKDEEISEWMDGEKWMTAAEAKELGFCDEVEEFQAAACAVGKLTVPETFAALFSAPQVDPEPVVEPASEPASEPVADPANIIPELEAKCAEMSARLESMEKALNKKQSEMDKAKAEAKAACEKLEKVKAKAEKDMEELRAQVDKLGGGFRMPETAGEGPTDWKSALAANGGDYVKTRKSHPQLYAQFMKQNKKN